jgi:hypothetical protein
MGLTTSLPPEGEHAGNLRCPRCGHRDELRLLADVPCSRRILGVAYGFVEIDRRAQVDPHELGSSFRFQCHARNGNETCGYRWPVPDWLVARLVFYS